MLVEGKGEVAPVPVPVPVSREIWKFASQTARHRQAKYWRWAAQLSSRRQASTYTAGLTPDAHAKGLVGEWAVAEYLNSVIGRRVFQVDWDFRERGDGGVDLSHEGVTIQCRTQGAWRNRGGQKKTTVSLPASLNPADWSPSKLTISCSLNSSTHAWSTCWVGLSGSDYGR